ncbi:ankyrin repeat-containing domain protein [Nemania sp. FL0031]|nr:ankyrin repeat-containing domain protein [Nemania sp. FL0031]
MLASGELSIQFDAFHILARAIYIISNQFNAPYRDCPLEIQLLFTRIPQKLVLDLFDTNLLSTRATAEGIGRLIPSIENKDTFISFMKVILTRPAWIKPFGHLYLSSAVSMGSVDTVRSLLKLGVRADQPFQISDECYEYDVWPAIYTAVASRNMECLELLVKDCDLNRNFLTLDDIMLSNFRLVLFCMSNAFTDVDSDFRGMELRFHHESVTIMIDNGADVDLLGCGRLSLQSQMEDFFQDNSILRTELSFLEHCYYYNKELYYLLALASERPAYDVHKDDICLAAAMGAPLLRNYLDSKPTIDNVLIESVFAEQFFVSDARIICYMSGSVITDPTVLDSTVIRGFLEAGVTINTSNPDKCFTPLLRLVIQKIQVFGFNENDEFVIHKLLDSGAVLNSVVLATAVSKEGTASLEILLSAKADFRHEGARALYKAARLSNFRAVSWLLRRGVDINAAVQVKDGRYGDVESFSVLAAVIVDMREDDEDLGPSEASLRMVQYLVDYGAKLWVNSPDSSPLVALRVILENSLDRFFNEFEVILSACDRDKILEDLPQKGSFFLEIILSKSRSWHSNGNRERTFQFFLEHNAPTNPGAVLAQLIRLKAPRTLVLGVMNSGADINAYTDKGLKPFSFNAIQAASQWWDQDLVSELLERGGDINSPAHNRTALQYACSVEAYSEEDKRTQISFIRFLLLKNSDINAPPAVSHGYTALQFAAINGDLELLSLLLSHGARINAPSHSTTRCALDLAAENGRLDALHFLLKAGALSYCHGQSGYEGAIRLADRKLFTVIADSIRDHVRNNEILFRGNADLATAHRAAMAERSWTDDGFSDMPWWQR